jgi:lipopolysaccharide biosynthesis glycosyltransferase
MKTIIVTASDEKYSPLLFSFLNSILRFNNVSDAIGLLDLGLSDKTLNKVKGHVTTIIKPNWDVPVDDAIKLNRPHERAKLSRPFLVDYFPGYDLYLWLDADTWLQDGRIISWFYKAASTGALAIVPSEDRCFQYTRKSLEWRKRHLFNYFGNEALEFYDLAINHYSRYSYYNSGAFCIRADAPHWNSWKKYFNHASENLIKGISDQAVLNYAIWKDNLDVYHLPAICNWPCHFSIPVWSERLKKFCEPLIPHAPIGLMHLTGDSKNFKIKVSSNGSLIESNLWFNKDR